MVMHIARDALNLNRRRTLQSLIRPKSAKFFHKSFSLHQAHFEDTKVAAARTYCSNLLQNFDTPSHILQTFIPRNARDAYLSMRALNVELTRIPDAVSNVTVGSLRIQFWRDNITRVFAHTPPKEPVAILLHNALLTLQSQRSVAGTNFMKAWFLKMINAREQYMGNRPFPSLDALETYAENTYSTMMYLSLAASHIHSLEADHIASHIGKAVGIAAVLRGLPLVAFPPPPNHHSNNSGFRDKMGSAGGMNQGAVVLPLEIMSEAGVKEEEVFRQGSNAPGLKDAVFAVATRANDHLITAREMLKNVQQGRDVGHDYEHAAEEGHQHSTLNGNPKRDLDLAFGVLMQAVPTQLWLSRLEAYDFDVFRSELRRIDWRLPWKSYWAYNKKAI